METLKGSHGTLYKHAQQIKIEGFKSSPGRRGTGIYFWAEQPDYVKLAFAWSRHFNKGEDYHVAIIAAFIFKDEYCLPLDNPYISTKINDLAVKQKISLNDETQICKIYDLLVEELEKELGYKFKILKTSGSPPTRECFKIKLLGAPHIIIVRDCDIIRIEKILEKENEC